MQTLAAIAYGCAFIGLCWVGDRLLSAYFLRKASRKPDNKDLFQK